MEHPHRALYKVGLVEVGGDEWPAKLARSAREIFSQVHFPDIFIGSGIMTDGHNPDHVFRG